MPISLSETSCGGSPLQFTAQGIIARHRLEGSAQTNGVLCCVGQGAMWEAISRALASLGPEALALSSSQPSQALLPPDSTDPEAEDPEGLVEYEGMLVSASAAQRRR